MLCESPNTKIHAVVESLSLFWCSNPLFPFSLSTTITLGLLLLHFGSRTIFFYTRSPPGRTSTTWLVVWGRDHRNRANAIKSVTDIYIYIYIYIQTRDWLHCTVSSPALRRSAIITRLTHANVWSQWGSFAVVSEPDQTLEKSKGGSGKLAGVKIPKWILRLVCRRTSDWYSFWCGFIRNANRTGTIFAFC